MTETKKTTKYLKHNPQAGVSLLIAVIVTGLLFLVSIAIINISLKQITFSSVGRESQFAFYVADAGVECAIYWDLNYPGGGSAFDPGPKTINCNGSSIAINPTIIGTDLVTVYNLNFPPDTYCTEITVIKEADGDTVIDAKGYNTCVVTSPRRVERGVHVDY